MHKGRIKKRDQPVAPCNPFLPAVALLTLPFWQWLFFPAVASSRWSSAAAPWPAKASRWLSATVPPSSSPWHSRPAALPRHPGRQKLPDGSPWQQFLPYSYSPRCCQHLCHSAASLQTLRHGAPASNKPHPAEKSTPVWLAIWRTWAGFANSQHRDAAFATTNNICAHSSLLPHWIAAQTLANLSAHLHRLPTPPPYLRRMRLSHGRGRRYRVLDEAVASQGCRRRMANAAAGCSWRSSCKSPRTLPKCKYLITKQLTFINALGELKSRPPRVPMCPRGA